MQRKASSALRHSVGALHPPRYENAECFQRWKECLKWIHQFGWLLARFKTITPREMRNIQKLIFNESWGKLLKAL